MQELKYEELENRASRISDTDLYKKLEANARVHAEIELMREEGKALTLSDEEVSMLTAFRRFKLRMRKSMEVFNWSTHIPDRIQVVNETAEIIYPNER